MSNEAEMVEIERQKLELEKIKIRSEARRAIWTSISVVVPLVGALVTVAFASWSAKEQARSQFRLEAVKAIMSAPTPTESLDRAELLSTLFPSDLAGLFATGKLENRPDAWVIRSQKELFTAMAAREMKPAQILDLWIAIFPDDEWAKRPDIRGATKSQPN